MSMRFKRGVPSSEELARLGRVGATSPIFLPATRHLARSPMMLGVVGLFALFALAMTYASTTDDETGWVWTAGAAGFTLFLAALLIVPFRRGVALDRGRIGIRRPLQPGTTWLDLDRVDLVIPGIHLRYGVHGARREGRRYPGPAGYVVSLNLWSRSQGFTGLIRWVARFRLIPRQRRFVDAAEADLGVLRVLSIDGSHFAPDAFEAVLLHLRCQLRPHQAEQLRDIGEYGELMRRWAEICYDVGGRHRHDWRRDPRTLDVADLHRVQGASVRSRPWWHRFRREQPNGPFA